MFYRILLVTLLIFVVSHYFYWQYEQIEREGGELKLFNYVIYSKSRPATQAITYKKESTDSQPAITKNNDKRTYHGQPLNSIEQTFQSTACPPRRDNSIETNRKARIYRWKDEHGRVTIADRPPQQIAGTLIVKDLDILDYILADKYFQLTINFKSVHSSEDLHNTLESSLKSVYQIIAGLLEKDHLRLSHVNLHVYGNFPQYRSVARKYYGDNDLPVGFYSSKDNLAVALMTPDNQQQGINTAIHESVHVLMSELFVTPPTWFNEGMAEYFETIIVLDSVATIHTNPDRFNKLRDRSFASKRSPLTHLVTLNGDSFYSKNQSTNYSAAWSLVAFLMKHKEGKSFMRHYVNYMAENYCRAKPTLQLMNQYYPGGVEALERAWLNWLMHGQQKAQIWRW